MRGDLSRIGMCGRWTELEENLKVRWATTGENASNRLGCKEPKVMVAALLSLGLTRIPHSSSAGQLLLRWANRGKLYGI